MATKHAIAAVLGAVFALALVLEGFGELLIVMLAAFLAWVVSRFLTGELDLSAIVGGGEEARRGR